MGLVGFMFSAPSCYCILLKLWTVCSVKIKTFGPTCNAIMLLLLFILTGVRGGAVA
jgi:hypothetical protein